MECEEVRAISKERPVCSAQLFRDGERQARQKDNDVVKLILPKIFPDASWVHHVPHSTAQHWWHWVKIERLQVLPRQTCGSCELNVLVSLLHACRKKQILVTTH